MTLEQVLATHLAPLLDATKKINFKYRGLIMDTVEEPDWDVQLKMLTLDCSFMVYYPLA
jgi:hypothetical protein